MGNIELEDINLNQNRPIVLSNIQESSIFSTDYIPPRQSANLLINFMHREEYLLLALKKKSMAPRYYKEDIKYLKLPFETVAFPITCFCDINLHGIKFHTQKYGDYGIGFYKPWMIKKGIQPIMYVNNMSTYSIIFKEAFEAALAATTDNLYLSTLKDQLVTQLCFMKAIQGDMYTVEGIATRNFHDEREWRYTPDFSLDETGLKPILTKKAEMTDTALSILNDAISERQNLCFNFDYGNVKYIVVPDSDAREKVLEYIENLDFGSDKHGCRNLCSKILVTNEIEEDW